MSLSRRLFFLALGTAASTVLAPTFFTELAQAQLSKTAAGAIDLAQIHANNFEPYQNQTFQVLDTLDQHHSFQLVKVRQLAQDAKTEQFSLLFKAPLTLNLPQETYTLEHRRLG
ncbi:MAG: hypothetical protein AAGG51_11960 [Cyanobacteria bacterium P01_G01_bin.54]